MTHVTNTQQIAIFHTAAQWHASIAAAVKYGLTFEARANMGEGTHDFEIVYTGGY